MTTGAGSSAAHARFLASVLAELGVDDIRPSEMSFGYCSHDASVMYALNFTSGAFTRLGDHLAEVLRFIRWAARDHEEGRGAGELRRGEARPGVRVHVNEAGGNVEARRVDGARGARGLQVPDGDDAVAADGDVGVVPRIAGTVEHAAAPDEEVVRRLRSGGA